MSETVRTCANGDGRPICPPSKVICRECMQAIRDTLAGMVEDAKRTAKGSRHD
jgi:hypothetical protein